MFLYTFLSKFGYLKSYKSKIVTVAAVGANLPLLMLVLFFVVHQRNVVSDFRSQLLLVALIASLLSIVIIFVALNSLLKPIELTAQSLNQYRQTKQIPKLPIKYTDAAGTLMASTTQIISRLDSTVCHLENCDETTGLLNRRVFQSRLEDAIATLPIMANLTVFVIDIDGFKGINVIESYGLGDRLLQEVGRRLLTFSGGSSFVSRLGNDEFAIFTVKPLDLESDCAMAKSILCLLNEPFANIDAKPHQVTASIGIATYPSDSQDAGQLIANAYAALEQSKSRGRNSYQFYYGEMSIALRKQQQLETDLKSALEKGQLVLHYQPRVNWRTGQIVSVEALLRWQHPKLGLLLPAQFIAIAENTNLIVPIGEWVLYTACEQCKTWQQAGISIPIAINLSAGQINQPGLDRLIQTVLQQTQLSAKYLELEVTESLLMGNTNHSLSVLKAIRRQGVSLALDDFGTGYSSLSYLMKFPFDVLKIDRSFVQDIVSSSEAAEITCAIVALAKGLGLNLIAEGVETEAQLVAIKNYGCEEVQGHYFSPPLVANELAELLQNAYPVSPSAVKQALGSRI